MKFIWWLFLLIVFVVVIAFSVLNSQVATLYYFIGQAELPLSVSVVSAFVLGGLIGILVGRCQIVCKSRKSQ